ncbi:EAL domain-containing protein [Pseudanabaena sp. ABRG5-3]|uniref:EAL domain-containing protein n=1 Tax=Pseudanabaena sp. ABRG5-3 TaxID=685565 RepID=UPI000DC725B6|nr:EAL domain-containing protein [Pseudanabaena sp. ABRG5-3]BBC24511.1 response regulator receiver modulated diguanylate cyclase/phosphodiesterase [Pseudanabaena sp. ABRG5-3]
MRFQFSEFISQLWANRHIGRRRSRLINLIWRALPTLFAIVIILPIVHFGILQPIEFWAYNSFSNWRGDRPWDDRVVIVAIDDTSISKIGRFPWNRDLYREFLQKLSRTEVNVIGFDILWSESSPADKALAEAIEQYQRVVLAMAWDKSGQVLLPTKDLGNAGVAFGHILKREDADGIVRQVDLQVQDIPSLGVAMLQTYALTTAAISPLPDLSQPLWINWTKHSQNMPQLSFVDVIDGKIPESSFRNKIVLVGVTASGIDSLSTPLDRNPPASGVHLHAMVIQNLLQRNSLTIAKTQDLWSIALLVSLSISLLLPRRILGLGCISAFSIAGLWFAIAFLAFSFNYWMAIAMPILLFLFTGGAISLQERWQIQQSLKIADAQILYDATHDRLTGLFNRAFIEDRLNDLLNPQDLSPKNLSQSINNFSLLIAVLWINLDRFKNINDIFGHPIGNLLLVEVGKCLRSCVPITASIARFGGAEFVILLENVANEQSVLNIADRIQKRLQETFLVQGNEIAIAANIGIKFHHIDHFTEQIDAQNTSELVSPETILRDADTAMYYAKKLGNSYSKVFEVAMRERVLERLQLEKDLRQAVAIAQDPHNQDPHNQDHQEFLIYYQPIVSLRSMQIVGLEALIRWRHPQRGLISPTYFIPLAEETGLIIPIGDWIMRHACYQLKSWHQRFAKAKDITISVNLSPKQLAQDDVLEKCLNVLQQTDLEPKYLKIELTESSIMENPNFAVSILRKMQEAGINIYIDDFGTGYSSLAYLHKFPFDGLKIDRSFVNNIHADNNGTEIIQAIIALAQSVNAHIVAEGIESLDQLNYLQDLLSEEGDGQGFFLFRPIDRLGIEALLETE